MIDFDVGEVLDRFDQQRRAAGRDRRVELVPAVAGNAHQGVPGERHQRGCSVRVQMGEHGGVRAFPGDDLLALVHVAGARPAVRSDQQEVRAPGRGRGRSFVVVAERQGDPGDLGVEIAVGEVAADARHDDRHRQHGGEGKQQLSGQGALPPAFPRGAQEPSPPRPRAGPSDAARARRWRGAGRLVHGNPGRSGHRAVPPTPAMAWHRPTDVHTARCVPRPRIWSCLPLCPG